MILHLFRADLLRGISDYSTAAMAASPRRPYLAMACSRMPQPECWRPNNARSRWSANQASTGYRDMPLYGGSLGAAAGTAGSSDHRRQVALRVLRAEHFKVWRFRTLRLMWPAQGAAR